MATIRISPKEVQVDETVYTFDRAMVADAFEACVATLDAPHCIVEHPPASTRPATDPGLPSLTTPD